MLLSPAQFETFARDVCSWDRGFLGIDFETNGLHARRGSRAFILGMAYRNAAGERVAHCVLTDCTAIPELIRLLVSNPRIKYGAHNAKFELAFLRHQFQAEVAGEVWDTEVFARVQHNTHMRYDLQSCAQRIGLEKYPPMLAWLKANKRKGLLHHHAPLELVIPYVEQDAWLEVPLYESQKQTFTHWETATPFKISPVIQLELKTTKNLFEVEDAGLMVNQAYCEEALAYEESQIKRTVSQFQARAGVPFIDSRKTLSPLFRASGITPTVTEKGNDSFSEAALAPFRENPLVAPLLEHRAARKRASSYWKNFLELGQGGFIYPNIRQCGAQTFRMSIAQPSAQNWSTDEDGPPFPIRRAFVCGPDQVLVSLDYAQMELRLMCDEAGDQRMADAFLRGHDFHQEVANDAGVPRSLAKNGRFAKLYGAGVPRIAATLGISLIEARKLCTALDEASPEINQYTRSLIGYAERHKVGYNWLGRRYQFDREFAYKYPNYRIQGGCAEIVRIALDKVQSLLRAHARGDSQVVLLVHDELVLRLDRRDIELLPAIRQAMIGAHPNQKILPMDVSVALGQNYHDLETWRPAYEPAK